MEEIRYDLAKPRIRTIQKYLETSSEHSVLVLLKARPRRKDWNFYETRSHAIILYNTLPVIFEKAVCMRTSEELYHKVYQSPRLPRVILKQNSQSGQQDQPDQEARKSSDHQSASDRS